MNKTVFFLVSLIVIALSSSSKAVSYDGIMDKLIEMNEAAGKDKNQISLLIAKVSTATQEANEKFDRFINDLVTRCSSGTRLQETYIKKIEADVLSAKARSNTASSDNKSLASSKITYGSQLAASQKELKALKKSINAAYEQYRVYGIEAEQKLVVIKTLKDIITDELLAKHGQSFVQVETFSDKVHELKAMLKDSDDSMSPLVSTLLELAEAKGFSNKKILSQILTVLNKLQVNVEKFRKSQETSGKQTIRDIQTQAKEKVKQIRSIARLLSDNNSQIIDNENIVAAAARDVTAFENHKIRKLKESQYWKKICKYQDGVKTRESNFRYAFTRKIKEVSAKLAEMQ